MQIAVSYLRCSGDGQIIGDTWNRQKETCQKYALSNGIEIAKEFRDEGITGKMELEGRAGLSACLQYIQENGIKLVVVESSDRLARDMIVAEVIIREFQKIGVRVISASGGIDLTEGNDNNPTAKLIRQILAAVAEFDRCVVVLKLRGARDRIRNSGKKCEGRFGYGEDPNRPDEHNVLSQMLTLRDQGNNAEQIARFLNAAGIPTRYGKTWISTSVDRILNRH